MQIEQSHTFKYALKIAEGNHAVRIATLSVTKDSSAETLRFQVSTVDRPLREFDDYFLGSFGNCASVTVDFIKEKERASMAPFFEFFMKLNKEEVEAVRQLFNEYTKGK